MATDTCKILPFLLLVALVLPSSPVHGTVSVSDGLIAVQDAITSTIKLAGTWQFIPDGSSRYKDADAKYDQEFYEKINDPSIWKRYYPSDKDYNVGWFRLEIILQTPQNY
ncbi:MAG TPA: hypothetical protein PL135_14935, partial [Spirochaetota bacterium]|nr:hypothetical protein [Spirochaetota bacterium]